VWLLSLDRRHHWLWSSFWKIKRGVARLQRLHHIASHAQTCGAEGELLYSSCCPEPKEPACENDTYCRSKLASGMREVRVWRACVVLGSARWPGARLSHGIMRRTVRFPGHFGPRLTPRPPKNTKNPSLCVGGAPRVPEPSNVLNSILASDTTMQRQATAETE
jgi:hypothetical protein